jgi:hypothetical protein
MQSLKFLPFLTSLWAMFMEIIVQNILPSVTSDICGGSVKHTIYKSEFHVSSANVALISMVWVFIYTFSFTVYAIYFHPM